MMRPTFLLFLATAALAGSGCLLEIDRSRLEPPPPDGGDADADADTGLDAADADAEPDAADGDADAEPDADGGAEDGADYGFHSALVLSVHDASRSRVVLIDPDSFEVAESGAAIATGTTLLCGTADTLFGLAHIDPRTDRLYRFHRTRRTLTIGANQNILDVHPTGVVLLSTGEYAITSLNDSKLRFYRDDLRSELSTVLLDDFQDPSDTDRFVEIAGGLEAEGTLWITLPHLDPNTEPAIAVAPGTLVAIAPATHLPIDLEPASTTTTEGRTLGSPWPDAPLGYDPGLHRLLFATRGTNGDGSGGFFFAVDLPSLEIPYYVALDGFGGLVVDLVLFPALHQGYALVQVAPGTQSVRAVDLETGQPSPTPLSLPTSGPYVIEALDDSRLAVISREASADALRVFDADGSREIAIPPVTLDTTDSACLMPAETAP